MRAGRVKCYATPRGRNLILAWYEEQDATVQAVFREFVDAYAQQPFERWCPPEIATLGGKWSKLHKFKLKAADKQLRPLGFFGPGQHEYTILFPAYEKGNRWDPKDARDQALKRMNEVLSNSEQAVDYFFPSTRRRIR